VGGAPRTLAAGLPAGRGWVEFDPTNALIGGRNLIPESAWPATPRRPLGGGGIYWCSDDFLSMNVTVEVTARVKSPGLSLTTCTRSQRERRSTSAARRAYCTMSGKPAGAFRGTRIAGTLRQAGGGDLARVEKAATRPTSDQPPRKSTIDALQVLTSQQSMAGSRGGRSADPRGRAYLAE